MLNFLMGAQPTTNMSTQEAVRRAKAGEITIIDVRDYNEVLMTGVAEGAIHIPLAVLQMQANPASPDFHPALDTDKPVAIYCATGARSSMATQILAQMGFRDVNNIGGLGHWQMAGGNIVRA